MVKFDLYIKYLFSALIVIVITGCGGTCTTNSNENNQPIVTVLPNSGGASVTIPVSSLSIPTGATTTSTAITLNGGTTGLSISLSSTVTRSEC